MPRFKVLIAALAATAALVAGLWAASRDRATAAATLQSGLRLETPRALTPFALTDHAGRDYTNERLRGGWTLLFAGFSHCGDICPATLAIMAQIEQRLGAAAPQMVFLTVDPARDTPERLREYLRSFSPALIGVTGAPEQIERLTAALALAYETVQGTSGADYDVSHSGALVLLDPQARVAAYFQPPHKVDTLAADLSTVVGAPPA